MQLSLFQDNSIISRRVRENLSALALGRTIILNLKEEPTNLILSQGWKLAEQTACG